MSSERGFALVTVVLLMIGLAVLATGLVFGASQQAAAAASVQDLARARRAAEAAVAIAIARWDAGARSRDAMGAVVTIVEPTDLGPGLRVSASSRRLGSSSFLIGGSAEAAAGGLPSIRQSAARLVRSLDVDSIVRALDAALVAGHVDVAGGGRVSGSAGTTSTQCSEAAAGAALRAPADSVEVAPGALLEGTPVLLPEAEPARLPARLGHLEIEELARAARSVAGPSVVPAPALQGAACDTASAGNWGSADGACGSHRVLVVAPDSLHLAGGYGQGVLIAEDDLVVDGGFRFRGLVIALGDLFIRDGSIEGAVVARAARVEGGALTLDRCALTEALAGVRALGSPRAPARSWIPTFD